jgi:DsbC/DsbD-like thiol-disulfide interchange protein/cytochrome c biogenesis protein CcdA
MRQSDAMEFCMRAWCFRLITMFAVLVAGPTLAEPTHIQPRLMAESSAPTAGTTVTVALDMRTEKGWHGYWSNPGEAGFAPRLTWTLPKGVTLSEPRFPVPETLTFAGLMNYVFGADHAILFDLTISRDIAKGAALPVRLSAEWLACTDQVCVPEKGSFSLDLRAGSGNRDNQAAFDAFRAKLPAPLGSNATATLSAGQLRMAIPFPADAKLDAPHFFPATSGLLIDAAPQKFSRVGDQVILTVPAPKDATGRVEGVLALGKGRGVMISADDGVVPPDGAPVGSAGASTLWQTILVALAGAMAGGLILNVMPCVLPIVSLKALSLARAGGDERAARREALAYSAGVMLTCVALGSIILGVRAGGSQLGWAFQLQDQRIVFLLLVLATAITLNLAGFYELRGIGGGQNLVDKGGTQGAFWTGVLAAFVATPCAGPFMAAALGAALILPVPAALAVFAGLGFGLALPFLLIGFVPALRRMMPKPGAWMSTFQRALAIPMALTVVALLWLIDRQSGATGFQFALLAVGMLVALAAFTGRRQSVRLSKVMPALLVVMLIGGVALIKTDIVSAGAPPIAATPFSEARLAALRTEKKPVFVYFTADWCLTCKVNEKTALETEAVRDAFRKGGVTVLVADWTDGNAAITRVLNSHGASGVPLYLYYAPGASEPRQLPQVLTPGTLTALTSA